MRPIGLYIHVPFCARACPYCDFDFVVGQRPQTQKYFDGLEREFREKFGDECPVIDTVYVGGGTPSMLGLLGLEQLCRWILSRFDTLLVKEWTVEVNPEHCSDELCESLSRSGVTRVSIGGQTTQANGLVQLGRQHGHEQLIQSITAARRHGLGVCSDLIVGWTGQTHRHLEQDIARMHDAGANHLSVYGLTVEEGSAWPKLVRRGLREEPDQDRQTELLLEAEELLEQRGFSHYEISNYAAPGAEGVHNKKYWCGEGYVGLGPSAHSAAFSARGVVHRRGNRRGFENWLEHPGDVGEHEVLSPIQSAAEALWLRLRYLHGANIEELLADHPDIDHAWISRRIFRHVENGNLEWVGQEFLKMGPKRWIWHDAIGCDLLE